MTGDPHFTTLDGITYTFNGRGEYTLVKALHTGFSVQGRTQPVSNTSNATQFSAFAMGIREQDLSAEVRVCTHQYDIPCHNTLLFLYEYHRFVFHVEDWSHL